MHWAEVLINTPGGLESFAEEIRRRKEHYISEIKQSCYAAMEEAVVTKRLLLAAGGLRVLEDFESYIHNCIYIAEGERDGKP